MCIAIFKPRKTKPDWEAYRAAYDNNPDGWGFAAARGGKLVVKKGVSSFNNFKKKFYEFRNCPSIVHFRIRTSGDIDDRNCHPFMVSPNLAVIHNGILDIQCNVNKKMSDTWHFVTQVLRPIHESAPAFPWNLGLSFLGESFLGNGNKMVFLSATGEHTIWNSDLGHTTKDRHWWSNYSYTYGSRFTGKVKTTSSSSSKGKSYSVTASSGYTSGYDRIDWSKWRDVEDTVPMDSIADTKDKDAEHRDLIITADKLVEQQYSQKTFSSRVDEDDLIHLAADDPLSTALGECTASDYDAAQGLVSAGLPAYALSELYKWWPESLEYLWFNYCTDFDEYAADRSES